MGDISIAVLCVRPDSVYKRRAGCDCFDKQRDARSFAGGMPVIAHPPCRAWGRLRHMAKPAPGERELALFCVNKVLENGGFLEHPAGSTLWDYCELPKPNESTLSDHLYTLQVDQYNFGHRARKRTWLLVKDVRRKSLPPMPIRPGDPEYVVNTTLRRGQPGHRPSLSRRYREATPFELALWMVEAIRIEKNPAQGDLFEGEE